MSLFFDNEKLFDAEGHLTDEGLYALRDGTLDELGSLEAAEHLTFCDYCLLRYTELVETMPQGLQGPMRDLIPQVQNLMRLRSFRLLTNRYVNVAAAVVLAFAIRQFGLFRAPSVPVHMEREQPRFTLQQAVDTMHEGFYGGISGWMDNARNSLDQLKDTDFGGKTVRGE